MRHSLARAGILTLSTDGLLLVVKNDIRNESRLMKEGTQRVEIDIVQQSTKSNQKLA